MSAPRFQSGTPSTMVIVLKYDSDAIYFYGSILERRHYLPQKEMEGQYFHEIQIHASDHDPRFRTIIRSRWQIREP